MEETIGLVGTEPMVRVEVKHMVFYKSTRALSFGAAWYSATWEKYPTRCKNPEDNTLTKKGW
jgi:hypothetical protein